MSDLIVNRYQLHQPIGQGAMGTVYRSVDVRMGTTVAVKFLAHTLQNLEMCDRFEIEAKASAQLSCQTDYIVAVSDGFELLAGNKAEVRFSGFEGIIFNMQVSILHHTVISRAYKYGH